MGSCVPAEAWSEEDVEEAVRARCEVFRVTRYHHRRSKGTTPGFPDDVLVGTRVLFRECKRERGRVTADQQACLEALAAAGQDVGVWRPSDVLSGRVDAEIKAVSTLPAYRSR